MMQYPSIFLDETKEVSSLPFTVKLQRKADFSPLRLPLNQFESLFHFKYRPFLTFSSRGQQNQIVNLCPYLLRLPWLAKENHDLAIQYSQELMNGHLAPVYVKWIDPQLEYGLFADEEIPSGSYIGEYTGIIRILDRKQSEYNPYCFHYPTRIWSWRFCLIDASRGGNLLRFVNHSKTPNLKPLCVVDNGLLHMIFVAKENIPTNTQLTFDYGI